jgi:hypothetical protein
MKRTVQLMMAIALLASTRTGAASDRLPTIPHWTNDEAKIVYFVPRGLLKVELDHLGSGDQYEYHFTVELSYDGSAMEKQFGEVQMAYPGYQVQRPILEKSQETYRLMIPSIGVNAGVEVKNGPVGPWIAWDTYLNKTQAEALQARLAADSNALRLQGELSADVPLQTTVERRELSQVTCESLLGEEASVGALIQGISALRKILDKTKFEYASTREALFKSAMSDCFQLQSDVTISSFNELLSVRLLPKRRGFHPVGETRKIAPLNKTVPLFYELSVRTN